MNARRYLQTRRAQRGQGVVEFVVAIVAFGALLLGIFQVALLYRAKTTLDYAAFMAARSGSMHGATTESLYKGLEKGLMPLYTTQPNVADMGNALGTVMRVIGMGQAQVQVISPTQKMFNEVKVPQFDGVLGIPNDSLAYRDDETRAANLLKVKVTYDYPLIVPVIDKLIGKLFGAQKEVPHAHGPSRMMWVIPLQATAIVRMQSSIRDPGALAANSGSGDSGGGGGGASSPLGGGSGMGSPGGGENPSLGGGDGANTLPDWRR